MLKESRLPSHYFPAYLKLDLGLGLKSAHPLALALDESFSKISEDVFLKTWGLQPDLFPEERQRSFLKSLGFKCEQLDATAVSEFYQKRSEIFKHRGSLKSLEILAGIYLGPAEVRRGRPGLKQAFPKEGSTRFALADSEDTGSVLYVRYENKLGEAKMIEFKENAQKIIPPGFRLEISCPVEIMPKKAAGFDLASQETLKERRL